MISKVVNFLARRSGAPVEPPASQDIASPAETPDIRDHDTHTPPEPDPEPEPMEPAPALPQSEPEHLSPAALEQLPTTAVQGAYFPLSYLTDMFAFLAENKDKISVMTYEDLDISNGRDHATNYETEYKAWRAKIATDEQASQKAHVLFQYDIDSRPDRMHALISHPLHAQVPANIMLFNKRVDRRHLKQTGEVRETDYPIDEDLLRQKQKQGFVIGYHTNAYELAEHSVIWALCLFDRDMRDMSKRYGVRFFSAHGGVPDAAGRNNNRLPYHPDWIDTSVWVHNGKTLRFDGVYSDGGHNSPKRDPATRDLRQFFSTFEPGKRYRILLHPQYYATDFGVSERFLGTPWYDNMIATVTHQPDQSLWAGVTLDSLTPSANDGVTDDQELP